MDVVQRSIRRGRGTSEERRRGLGRVGRGTSGGVRGASKGTRQFLKASQDLANAAEVDHHLPSSRVLPNRAVSADAPCDPAEPPS